MFFRNLFSPVPRDPIERESPDNSNIELQIPPPVDFANTGDRTPSPLTGDSLHNPNLGPGSVPPAAVSQYGGAFLGGGAVAEEIDDDEDEDEDEDEGYYHNFGGAAVPTTALAHNNPNMFHHFGFSLDSPTPFHGGFRTNDEDGEPPDRSLVNFVSVCVPEEGTVFDPPTGEVIDLDIPPKPTNLRVMCLSDPSSSVHPLATLPAGGGPGVYGSTHPDSPESKSADKGSVSSSASTKSSNKWGKSPRGVGDKGPQPLGVKPLTNQWLRRPGGKWEYIDERFGKVYKKDNHQYASPMSIGQWKRRDSHKIVWVKVANGKVVPEEEEEKDEVESQNALSEGTASGRKGNDLEWIQLSDDEFVVQEKDDSCTAGSDGAEEKQNTDANDPDNNDEFRML